MEEEKQKSRKIPISFGPITDKNIEQLKVLNQVSFPVKYSQHFYLKVLRYQKYSRMAYFNDVLVGAMVCRVEIQDNIKSLYILTIGVLEAYRQCQVGSQMMEEILKLLKHDSSINYIYLHMQTSNTKGLAFYKKFGFEIEKTLENYYEADINPRHCYILKKYLQPQQHQQQEQSQQ